MTIAPYDGETCEEPFGDGVAEYDNATKLTLVGSVALALLAFY